MYKSSEGCGGERGGCKDNLNNHDLIKAFMGLDKYINYKVFFSQIHICAKVSKSYFLKKFY